MEWFGDVAALVGALGIGSVAGALVGQGSDRRQARATALEAIREVEYSRWAPCSAADLDGSLHSLATAGLLAQMPRGVAEQYTVLAWAAWLISTRNFDRVNGAEGGEGIDAELAALVRRTARIAVQVVWRPWLARPVAFVRIRWLRSQLKRISSSEVQEALELAQHRV